MSRGVPVSVIDLTCLACSTMFVATGPAADELDALPAMARMHRVDPLGPGRVPIGGRREPVSVDERERLVDAATPHALAAGWVRRTDGEWACPRHAETFGGGGNPRRFTVRELLARHRAAGTLPVLDRPHEPRARLADQPPATRTPKAPAPAEPYHWGSNRIVPSRTPWSPAPRSRCAACRSRVPRFPTEAAPFP